MPRSGGQSRTAAVSARGRSSGWSAWSSRSSSATTRLVRQHPVPDAADVAADLPAEEPGQLRPARAAVRGRQAHDHRLPAPNEPGPAPLGPSGAVLVAPLDQRHLLCVDARLPEDLSPAAPVAVVEERVRNERELDAGRVRA